MSDHFTVLGGWGISPDVLRPVFGNRSTYIDVNDLMLSAVEKGALRPDWRDIIISQLRPKMAPTRLLAGWSTGALVVAACASHLDAEALVLLSATPSFCRTSGFRHGMRSSVLHAMQERLAADPPAVIADFRKKCGLPQAAACTLPWSAETLSAGLTALEHMSILDSFDTILPTLLFHGKNDRIISIAAAEFFGACSGGTFIELDGGHACFIDNTDTIKSAITNFLGGINNGSV